MKTVITRKKGQLKIDVIGLWDMYEALYDNCQSEEEVKLLNRQLDGLHEFIADMRMDKLVTETKEAI